MIYNPQFSVYGFVFGARRAGFDLDAAICNFRDFAEEVVIATLAVQEDDTLERLRWHESVSSGSLKVVVVDTDINKNNRFDGDLKTAALQVCSHPIRIIMDADERFVSSQRPMWEEAARRLITNVNVDGWLLPTLDLFGSRDHIRADQPIGLKFRMHKNSVVRRGVPHWAERGGGYFDTSKSDSTEALRANGELASFSPLVPAQFLHPTTASMLSMFPYVVHEGFLDLQRRANLGRDFWKKHWEARSGGHENVVTKVEDFCEIPVIKHNLKLT